MLLLIGSTLLAQTTYASVNFSSGKVITKGVEDYNSSSCTLEDRYDSSYHLKMFRGSSFSFSVQIPDDVSSASISLRHLTSLAAGEPGNAPITMYINNKKVTKWTTLDSSYQDDKIDVSNYLRAGSNTIELDYASNSGDSGYWLKYIQLYIW
jgi:hypothetical protein